MVLKGSSTNMKNEDKSKSAAIIVAHPDDETLWAGGTILSHPHWTWHIISLCRSNDLDRAPKFQHVLQILGATGKMGDMDDGPEQKPLSENEVQDRILELLPAKHFDIIFSHSPLGEYARHLRHEETGRAVITLWQDGKISADELWLFAYEDGGKEYCPRPIESAHICRQLPDDIWSRKYKIINEIYGFEKGSFETETTPRAEAFWRFTNPHDTQLWLKNGGTRS